MTAYVDNAGIPAKVGGFSGRWSHLTADTPDELHQLAEKIGLLRRWYQGRCKTAKNCPEIAPGSCRHFHYDVTATKRRAAIAAGAREIDMREFGDLIRARAVPPA